jgi:hypothetical protein
MPRNRVVLTVALVTFAVVVGCWLSVGQGQGNAAALRPATSAVAYGYSQDPAVQRLWPSPRILRLFLQNPASLKPSSYPIGTQLWISFTTAPSIVDSGSYNATFASILRSWNASEHIIYWDWEHEADDPIYHLNSTEVVKGWNQLLSVEHANPNPRVKSMSIYEGYLLAPNHPHGNPASWYVNADVLGFDAYQATNELLAMAYSKSKHKPWAVPETGHEPNDAQDLTWLKAYIAAFQAYPPIGVAWYDQLHPNHNHPNFANPLNTIPEVLAYLRSID